MKTNRKILFVGMFIVIIVIIIMAAGCMEETSVPQVDKTENISLVVDIGSYQVYRFVDNYEGKTICYIATRYLGDTSPSIWCR